MSLKPETAPESLLDELQTTLAHGTVARRVETLRRVTDLFINGSVNYSNEQIVLFDDVFQCLLEHIENSAKALLANRLAPIDTAPPQTIRTLAFDDLIEVAGPVLTLSPRLASKPTASCTSRVKRARSSAFHGTRTISPAALSDIWSSTTTATDRRRRRPCCCLV